MFELIYGYFRVYWNRYSPKELKRNYRGGTNSLQRILANMVA